MDETRLIRIGRILDTDLSSTTDHEFVVMEKHVNRFMDLCRRIGKPPSVTFGLMVSDYDDITKEELIGIPSPDEIGIPLPASEGIPFAPGNGIPSTIDHGIPRD
ncbi:unnamed protein product [marine sediment metagenome]|uniref:Uncharacterized protein n=1 Tax=marine sediment metagenome TaxID=412755 RepID=X1AXN8_9ZZZZ